MIMLEPLRKRINELEAEIDRHAAKFCKKCEAGDCDWMNHKEHTIENLLIELNRLEIEQMRAMAYL